MKRKVCTIVAVLAIIITALNVGFLVKDEFFYGLDNLPDGKLLRTEINQNILFSSGMWLEVFEVEATSEHPAAIRVVLNNNQTGKSRTIYWQIGTSENLISWPEDQADTVIINGVPVNYINGYYDCRDYADFIYKPKSNKNGNL